MKSSCSLLARALLACSTSLVALPSPATPLSITYDSVSEVKTTAARLDNATPIHIDSRQQEPADHEEDGETQKTPSTGSRQADGRQEKCGSHDSRESVTDPVETEELG